MEVGPFRGLRPARELASRIPSLPYDVIDSDEARELAAGDPDTFLHVVKAEIDLDPSIPHDDDRVYEKARQNLRALIDSGRMIQDPDPAYYVYRLTMDGHAQTGIVGVASAGDYASGRIKRHEHTRPDKVLDRARHAKAIGAHAGPLFLAHKGSSELEAAAERAAAGPPDADFVAPGGIRHSLWRVDAPGETARIESAFRDLAATYIADGHHRAAAYAQVAEALPGEAQRFLAVHFPASQLRILDYNRVVRDLRGLDAAAFLSRLCTAGFRIEKGAPAKRPPRPGTFGMYLDGGWSRLEAGGSTDYGPDAIARLDVSILMDRILGPILGVGDPRTDRRIDFVGGIRGTDELERRVDSGDWAVAFSLFPTRMSDVMAVADSGTVMPPKSTWFEPKLRSGMVVHRFD